jgi:hypothetical protein
MWHYPSPPLARVSSVGTKVVSSHISKTVRLGVAELGYDKFIVRAPKNNTSKRRAYEMS